MAICASRETLLQQATGIRRGRVYPVAKTLDGKCNFTKTTTYNKKYYAAQSVVMYKYSEA